MVEYHPVNEFRFKVENLSKGKVGLDWTGLLGKISLVIDDEEVFSKDFELTSTIRSFHDGLINLLKLGYDHNWYFCCGCGDHGCFYVDWETKLVDDTVFIRMSNLINEPVGKEYYAINIEKYFEEIIKLFDEAITYIKKNDISGLFIGNPEDFSKWKEEILIHHQERKSFDYKATQWYSKSRELFPEVIEGGGFFSEAHTLYSVWHDLRKLAIEAHKKKDNDFLRKIYYFVEWCFNSKEDDNPDVMVASFYEYLVHSDDSTSVEMVRRLSKDMFKRVVDYYGKQGIMYPDSLFKMRKLIEMEGITDPKR